MEKLKKEVVKLTELFIESQKDFCTLSVIVGENMNKICELEEKIKTMEDDGK